MEVESPNCFAVKTEFNRQQQKTATVEVLIAEGAMAAILEGFDFARVTSRRRRTVPKVSNRLGA
jgi:hypothetical protein